MSKITIISIVSVMVAIVPVFAVEDGALIPVTKIPCSNLYTGIYYKITLGGKLLTWTYDKTPEGYNHVKIVHGEGAKNFGPGKQYDLDTHWMILPSEKHGYYMIINRGAPHSPLTYGSESTSGKWVVLVLDGDKNPDYQKGGKFRSDILWKFQSKDGDEGLKFYNIINHTYRTGSGIMTYSNADKGAGINFCQIYTDGQKLNFEEDKDYLWEFEHVAPTVVAAKGKDSERRD